MKRVLIGQFKHEGNGFNRHHTTLDDFTKQGIREGAEMLDFFRDVNLEPTGFIDVGEEQGWKILPTISAFAPPGGPVDDATFENLCDRLIAATKEALPLDGVLLSLHGSMVVGNHPIGTACLISSR